MKRPAHLTLVDADKIGAVFAQRTEWRERAEKAEARVRELEGELAGRALMDAEGDAFLSEVVKQLQSRIEELKEALRLAQTRIGHGSECTDHTECGAISAALRGEEENEPESFCPACDAGIGQCNGPHKGNAGEVPY